MAKNKLAEKMKELCNEMEISYKDFCSNPDHWDSKYKKHDKKCNYVSERALRRYTRLKNPLVPGRNTKQKICNVLGMELSELESYLPAKATTSSSDSMVKFFEVRRGYEIYESLISCTKFATDYSYKIEGGDDFTVMKEFLNKIGFHDRWSEKVADKRWDQKKEADFDLGYFLAEFRKRDLVVVAKSYLIRDNYSLYTVGEYSICYELRCVTREEIPKENYLPNGRAYWETPENHLHLFESAYFDPYIEKKYPDTKKIIHFNKYHIGAAVAENGIFQISEAIGIAMALNELPAKHKNIYNDDFFGCNNKEVGEWDNSKYHPGMEDLSGYWIWQQNWDADNERLSHCYDPATEEVTEMEYKDIISDYDVHFISKGRGKAELVKEAYLMKIGEKKPQQRTTDNRWDNPYYHDYITLSNKRKKEEEIKKRKQEELNRRVKELEEGKVPVDPEDLEMLDIIKQTRMKEIITDKLNEGEKNENKK